MNKWLWAIVFAILANCAATYIVPLWERDREAMGGMLKFAWPWAIGDKGFLGEMLMGKMPMAGFVIAMAAACLFLLAILALFGIWVPTAWWPYLAIAGAVAEIVLMCGFFGITKILPILGSVAVIAALWVRK